jgi:putative glutamine amidotransferase
LRTMILRKYLDSQKNFASREGRGTNRQVAPIMPQQAGAAKLWSNVRVAPSVARRLRTMPSKRPVIGIPADRRMIGQHAFHAVGEKYIRPLVDAIDAVPLLIPSFGERLGFDELIDHLDGILFTGSPSNVEPRHYKGDPSDEGTLHDPERDSTTLPLIPRAVKAGVPVFGICRGFQEMNVAYGGTLHQKLHEVPGHLIHHEDESKSLEIQYGPAHDVLLEPGGVLRELAGSERVRVNSVHYQGVRDLAPDLIVEARAPDGVVEAFRVAKAPTFALAVQWHPEWQVMSNPFSRAIFDAFGTASRDRARGR